MRLLLVEDDPRMRALVRRGLIEQGHRVDVAEDGDAALAAARAGRYDVLILDVMLPQKDGLEVVRTLRHEGHRTPVLMLTARDAAAHIVAGLDAGADDYLVKPFSFAVLLARVRALGRRTDSAADERLTAADLVLDPAARSVVRSGVALNLTRTEYNLLECLLRQTGRVVTRDTLVARGWGDERDVERNTLDAFMKSLRHKLDAGGRPRLIHTVRGVGYSLREEPEC